jgi:hypothetical protein
LIKISRDTIRIDLPKLKRFDSLLCCALDEKATRMRPPRLSHPIFPVGRKGLANPQGVTGLTMMVVGLLITASLLQSTSAQSKTLSQENATVTPATVIPNALTPTALTPAAPQQSGLPGSQPVLINGRAVFAVPIVTGPQATALLQQVQANDHAHVVHDFAGWGKAVSTMVGWFRCADMLQANEYRGNQVEVEAWLFLSEQERLEAQAACTL